MSTINAKVRQIPLAVALLAAGLAMPQLVRAQTAAQAVAINIPAQPAATALKAFIEQTRFQLVFAPETVDGVRTNAVTGSLTPREALAKLLEGTGINIVSTGSDAATLQKKPEVSLLDMVVVTARKKEERMLDIPIAITALSGEELKRRGANSIADVMQDSPGVSSFDYGSGLTKISIRGISTSLGGNENGYYLNELPFTGVTVPLSPDVRAWDLDHIEILRGPQGTLFGEGSMGGTVRIITNRPRLNEWSYAGQVSGSTTQGGESSNGQKVMLNVPLGDMLAIRMAATHEKLGGWVDDTATDRKNINSSKIDTGRVAAVFEPTDRLRIDASYWKYKGEFDTDNKATDSGQAPPTQLANGVNYQLTGISANYDFDDMALFYSYARNRFNLPQSGVYFGGTLEGTISMRMQTHELRLGSTSKGPLKWTVGYYHRAAERSDSFKLAIFGLDNKSDTDISGGSVFGEVSYTLPNVPVELTAGVRRFEDRIKNQDYDSGIPASPLDTKFSSTNPRFSVSWHVSDLWQIYTSAAKGFRSGQAQPSASRAIAAPLGIPLPDSLPPDSIWSYELGTKASLLNRKMIVEAAIYQSNWKNFAVRIPLGNTGLNGLTTSPGTRTRGIEGSVRYEFSKNFSAAVNASYTDAEYSGSVNGTGIRKGSRVDEVAPVVFGGSLDYGFDAFSGWGSRIHVGYQHSSKRSYPSFTDYLPGDTINNLNARVSFEKGPWILSFFGENLSNDDGAISPRTTQVLSATETIAYASRLRPRTIGLELRYWMGR